MSSGPSSSWPAEWGRAVADYEPGITVVIPTIPPREKMAERAMESVGFASTNLRRVLGHEQFTVSVAAALDTDKEGAARTRHRALESVGTEWVAFLDDDDEFLPNHLTELYMSAQHHGADYLWSRFRIQYPSGQTLAGPAFLGDKAFSQWDDSDPCQTTITTLVRTELALQAGGFAQFDDAGELIDGQRRGEDHEFTIRCRAAGAVFRHVPVVTWVWHHHEGNTSGLPDRW